MKTSILVEFYKNSLGRYDFTNDDLLLYLNAGQKFLDDLTDHAFTQKEVISFISEGAFYLAFNIPCKILNNVTLIDKDLGQKLILQKVDMRTFKLLSATIPAMQPQDIPGFCTIGNMVIEADSAVLLDPTTDQYLTDDGIQDQVGGTVVTPPLVNKFSYIDTGTAAAYNVLLLNCPTSQAFVVDIEGKFYSPNLDLTADNETWWSLNYPLLLIQAANYHVDFLHNNVEGVAEKLKIIQFGLKPIMDNVVEQETNSIKCMKG